MKNITFQQELLFDIKDEVQDILLCHWEEIALNKETVPLDPDWEMYAMVEKAGILNITTARDNGKIVGYFAYMIVPNFHYKSLRIAEGDIFYIDKAYRKSRLVFKLLAESEKNVIAAGVNKIINKTKEHFRNANNLSANLLFEHAGYTKIENLYAKMVGVQ